MAAPIKIDGLGDIEKSLNKAIAEIEGNTKDGIEAAAFFIEGESKKLTSIDEGVLIGSAFKTPTPDRKSFTVGYSAEYAATVHERGDGTNWNRPGAENKFLEKAVSRNLTKILNLIVNIASRNPE